MLHCYLCEGIVYVPTIVNVSDGGSISIDPVVVVSLSDISTLTRALRKALIRPVGTISPLPRDDERPHPVLKYTRAKSWGAFERKARPWSISKHDGSYTIIAWRKARGEGYLYDESRCRKLPKNTSPDEAVRQLIEILAAQPG